MVNRPTRLLTLGVLSLLAAIATDAQTPAALATRQANATPSAEGAPGNTAKKEEGTRAVRAVVSLRTAVTSRGNVVGKEIQAALKQEVVLPDGTALPKGTMLHGVVAHVSSHGKGKPNGALMLVFTEATTKGGPVIPLLVKMRQLDSEVSDTVTLPGARLGGTSNSGGTQQLASENNDHVASLTLQRPDERATRRVSGHKVRRLGCRIRA